MDLLPVHIAVLTIADGAGSDRAATAAIVERATSAGHVVIDEDTVKDTESAIRDQLVRWIAEPSIDVVIVAASVESEAASAALAPLIMQTLPGFTDLFRWLTFQEIGTSAMQSAAEAAQCESTFVFVLPAHEVAVRAAMDKLILPQLDARTKPKNLVTQMPRLKADARRVQAAPAPQVEPTVVPAAALHAVPTPIAMEKTEGGSGVLPKPPARDKKPTTNTIARKPDDPPTKEIDLARLEKQIALSTQHDAQTKQVNIGEHDAKTKVVDMSAHQAKTRVVDMTGRVLPRLPPGADDSASGDDEPLTFTAPPPARIARPATTTGSPSATPLPAIPKPASGTTPPALSPARPTPQVSVPSFSTPVTRKTPPTMRPPTAPITSGVAATTTPKPPPAGAIASTRQNAVTPVSPASAIAARESMATPPTITPPALPTIGAREAAITPPSPLPTVAAREAAITPVSPVSAIAARDRAVTPVSEAPTAAAEPAPVARPRPPTAPPPPPIKAEAKPGASANAATAGTAAATAVEAAQPEVENFDAVDAPLSAALTKPAVRRKPTQPPLVDPLAAVTTKPLGAGDLPQGDFVYPIKRSGGWLLKLVVALAVLGLGFFAFVQLYPMAEQSTQTAAVTPEPAPAPVAAPAVPTEASDAAAPSETPAAAGSDTTEIEIEPPPVQAPAAPADLVASDDTTKPTKHTSRSATRRNTKPGNSGAVTRPDAADSSDATAAGSGKPASDGNPASDSKPEPSGDPSCDEVSCVLAKYDRPCCERYRPTEGFTPTVGTPEELDKRMVKAGVEKIKPRVVACGEKRAASGTVRLAVTVDGEGTVKSVSVTESPDAELGECVAAAMRKATFGKTVKGGEFVYPFVF